MFKLPTYKLNCHTERQNGNAWIVKATVLHKGNKLSASIAANHQLIILRHALQYYDLLQSHYCLYLNCVSALT